MKEFLEKIGVYDFFVMLGSGGIMASVLFVINEVFHYIDSDKIKGFIANGSGDYQILPLAIISISLGMIFQELSSIISNSIIDRNNSIKQFIIKVDIENKAIYAEIIEGLL